MSKTPSSSGSAASMPSKPGSHAGKTCRLESVPDQVKAVANGRTASRSSVWLESTTEIGRPQIDLAFLRRMSACAAARLGSSM